jgi:hypothetical protein
MTREPLPNTARILAAICAVMEVVESELPGKITPRTKPRIVWARNMAAFVMHDLGISDGRIATAFGDVHRITIMVRRRRMAEKFESSQRYRDHHGAILKRLASEHARRAGEASPVSSRVPTPLLIHQPSS